MLPTHRLATCWLFAAACWSGCAGPEGGDPPDTAEEEGRSAVPVGPRSVSSPDAPSIWAYVCSDDFRFTVHYREGEASLDTPEHGLILPGSEAASGARYALGDTVFWDRGGVARLEVGTRQHEECEGGEARSSEDAARLLGFEFRGVGQEPGWLVDVDPDRQLRWLGDYGEVRFATGAPAREELESGVVVWRAERDGHAIRVTAEETTCRDSMSGREFTHTVRVEADGRPYSGCGRWLTGGR